MLGSYCFSQCGVTSKDIQEASTTASFKCFSQPTGIENRINLWMTWNVQWIRVKIDTGEETCSCIRETDGFTDAGDLYSDAHAWVYYHQHQDWFLSRSVIPMLGLLEILIIDEPGVIDQKITYVLNFNDKKTRNNRQWLCPISAQYYYDSFVRNVHANYPLQNSFVMWNFNLGLLIIKN